MRIKIAHALIAATLCLALIALPAQALQLPGPNPELSITASPFPMVINQVARITLSATNVGTLNADNVVVTDGVPNNLYILSVYTSQGSYSVYNSAVTILVGTIVPGQTVTMYIDVVPVKATASDTPFNNCAGLTFFNGTARLSCLPNQPAVSTAYPASQATLAPNGARPIDDPNRPPVFLPVAGGTPIDMSGFVLILGAASLLAAKAIARKRG